MVSLDISPNKMLDITDPKSLSPPDSPKTPVQTPPPEPKPQAEK